ncbi:formate dehydrogenase accessory sulfurtransferase FdhD [Bacillus sp. FJAT-47783]|uniref:formate dehydrogenase accessory sulfurtransferase FdhD n=1 Tax=Bacillus sp. FJAT-47783 TaxID=2922712 RepID=UPI001FABCE9A|nr:formate dehydrogenase accessory sulfurtransferase FdhD [Bacillus sp. FJAT-47783]
MTTNRHLIGHWEIVKYTNAHIEVERDEIALEYPLTVFVNGEEFATLICSPADIKELVIGFLASEGMIRSIMDVQSFHLDRERGFSYVNLHTSIQNKKEFVSKRMIGSCCGKSRQFYFYQDAKTAKTILKSASITPEQCFYLMTELNKYSTLFKRTGGLHNAALCTTEGVMQTFCDIGRHNVLDKIYGYCLLHDISIHDKVIAFSGRMSSEVILKVAKIGCGILLSKSAPTDLALKLANDLRVTTVGFIRNEKMNIYTHSERILIDKGDGESGESINCH